LLGDRRRIIINPLSNDPRTVHFPQSSVRRQPRSVPVAALGDAGLNRRARARFDEQLEWVLERLPPLVHELIEQVPLHVEDYPSAEIMAKLRVRHRSRLCGLYTGIPLTDRSVEHSGTLPDVITVFREGILSAARDARGWIRTDRLRREIRKTILHELGHHHGLDEDELRELGYG
jgi:predicted Zn-dependent protease with MMP-like domain